VKTKPLPSDLVKGSREQFAEGYLQLLATAFESGVRTIAIRTSPPFTTGYRRRFLSACHRGYAVAQAELVESVKCLRTATDLSRPVKDFRELVLRKVMDAVAFVMLEGQDHALRRLSYMNDPQAIDLHVLEATFEEATRLNAESRLTFALIADLTTSIQVADILRVDLRGPAPSLQLIELKSGAVNSLLLAEIDKYEPTPEGLERFRRETALRSGYSRQADRMLRQRLRLAQALEGIRSSSFVDVQTQLPANYVEVNEPAATFDEDLDQLCTRAIAEGRASASLERCVHLGVGSAASYGEAHRNALEAAEFAFYNAVHAGWPGYNEAATELVALVPPSDLFLVNYLFEANARSTGTRPFPLWAIERSHLQAWLCGRLAVLAVFDLVGFFAAARQAGVDIGLTSRRLFEELAAKHGKYSVPSFGGRAIELSTARGKTVMLGGMYARFFCSLFAPISFLRLMNQYDAQGLTDFAPARS